MLQRLLNDTLNSLPKTRCLVALLPCCLVALLPCCLVALLPRCLVASLPLYLFHNFIFPRHCTKRTRKPVPRIDLYNRQC